MPRQLVAALGGLAVVAAIGLLDDRISLRRVNRVRGTFRPVVTRLRVLRRGWGRFVAEEVVIANIDQRVPEQAGVYSDLDQNEILDFDDEDAETRRPYESERPN